MGHATFCFSSIVDFNSVIAEIFLGKVMKKPSKTGNLADSIKGKMATTSIFMMNKRRWRMRRLTLEKAYLFCATVLLISFLIIVCGIKMADESDHDDKDHDNLYRMKNALGNWWVAAAMVQISSLTMLRALKGKKKVNKQKKLIRTKTRKYSMMYNMPSKHFIMA